MIYERYTKRIFDVLLAILLLPFLMVASFLIFFFIKLEDRGPLFYIGDRIGKNGVTFKMVKFRTMKVNSPDLRNSDGSTFNSSNDPRLLKIGKFIRNTSLDELPQILNVLSGDMSFIGPRPDLPEHLNYYVGNEMDKLKVLPGITGYNQAFFRNSIDWSERKKNDVYYARNVSMEFDLKILLKTIESVVLRKNIYGNQKEANL